LDRQAQHLRTAADDRRTRLRRVKLSSAGLGPFRPRLRT
jgi:hypothetical protein